MAKRRFKRGICQCTGTVGYWFRKRGKNEKKGQGTYEDSRGMCECTGIVGY